MSTQPYRDVCIPKMEPIIRLALESEIAAGNDLSWAADIVSSRHRAYAHMAAELEVDPLDFQHMWNIAVWEAVHKINRVRVETPRPYDPRKEDLGSDESPLFSDRDYTGYWGPPRE